MGIPPILSYAAKWVETSPEYQNTLLVCPARIEPELAERIGAVALRAFRAVSGWGYGRVDTRLDEEGEPRVLEVNCNPCLDEGMGLARSAEKAGIEYPQLLQVIIRAALEGAPYDTDVPMFPTIGLASAASAANTKNSGPTGESRSLRGNPSRIGEIQGQRRGQRRQIQELDLSLLAAEL